MTTEATANRKVKTRDKGFGEINWQQMAIDSGDAVINMHCSQ